MFFAGDPILERTKIRLLIQAVPGIGAGKTNNALAYFEFPLDVQLCHLSPMRRKELLAFLSLRHPKARGRIWKP